MIKIIGSILIGITLITVGVLYSSKGSTSTSFGGVTGDVRTATTTDSTYANSRRAIKSVSGEATPGVLGNVVVTTTSATVVEIKDALSTTDSASTTLARFGASPATGTYIFDASFSRGLYVNFLGSFTGNYTITYQ